MMGIASGHLFLTALLTISLYHGKTEKVAKKRPKSGQKTAKKRPTSYFYLRNITLSFVRMPKMSRAIFCVTS